MPEGAGSAGTLAWDVPISKCGITTTDVAASANKPAELHHVIYMNPSASSAHVMHQVKITCKHVTLLDERIVSKIIIFWP